MADNLTLKVSESDYREALNTLNTAVTNLGSELQKLQAERGKLETNFVSKALSTPLRDMIKSKETQVQGSIDSIKTQIKQIENLLTMMSTAEQTIDGKIKEAAQNNVEAFM